MRFPWTPDDDRQLIIDALVAELTTEIEYLSSAIRRRQMSDQARELRTERIERIASLCGAIRDLIG